MARFRFRLQPLLEQRLRSEQEAQRALATLENRRGELEDRLRGGQQRLQIGREALRTGLVGRVDTDALRLRAAATHGVMRDAQVVVQELAGLQQRIDRARAILLDRTKERRALELLRERRLEAWNREEAKREIAALDDLATSRAAQRAIRGTGRAHDATAAPVATTPSMGAATDAPGSRTVRRTGFGAGRSDERGN